MDFWRRISSICHCAHNWHSVVSYVWYKLWPNHLLLFFHTMFCKDWTFFVPYSKKCSYLQSSLGQSFTLVLGSEYIKCGKNADKSDIGMGLFIIFYPIVDFQEGIVHAQCSRTVRFLGKGSPHKRPWTFLQIGGGCIYWPLIDRAAILHCFLGRLTQPRPNLSKIPYGRTTGPYLKEKLLSD